MKRVLIISGFIALVALTGCMSSSVPRTRLNGTFMGQPFSIESPKDTDIKGLCLSVDTNQVSKLSIAEVHTRMNPEVITTTGDAQVKMLNAAFDAGIKAAATGLKASAGVPVP